MVKGIDFPNVKIVCTVGLPSTIVDALQRGGRAIRIVSVEPALFVVFYDPWALEINKEEYTYGSPEDPIGLQRSRRRPLHVEIEHLCHRFCWCRLWTAYGLSMQIISQTMHLKASFLSPVWTSTNLFLSTSLYNSVLL